MTWSTCKQHVCVELGPNGRYDAATVKGLSRRGSELTTASSYEIASSLFGLLDEADSRVRRSRGVIQAITVPGDGRSCLLGKGRTASCCDIYSYSSSAPRGKPSLAGCVADMGELIEGIRSGRERRTSLGRCWCAGDLVSYCGPVEDSGAEHPVCLGPCRGARTPTRQGPSGGLERVHGGGPAKQ